MPPALQALAGSFPRACRSSRSSPSPPAQPLAPLSTPIPCPAQPLDVPSLPVLSGGPHPTPLHLQALSLLVHEEEAAPSLPTQQDLGFGVFLLFPAALCGFCPCCERWRGAGGCGVVSPALRRARASRVGAGLQPWWDLLLLVAAVRPQCYCQQTQQNPKPGKIWVTINPHPIPTPSLPLQPWAAPCNHTWLSNGISLVSFSLVILWVAFSGQAVITLQFSLILRNYQMD